MMIAARLVAALALSTPPLPTGAPSRPAAEAAEEALSHYEAGRHDEARTAIARAYMIEPWPEYLYARAQIERADGDCVAAREFYTLYLDAEPSQRGADLAREGIEQCPVTAPPPVVAREDVEPAKAKPRIDPLGVALASIGGTGLLVGSGLYIGMAVNRRAAERASELDEFGAHYDRARRLSVPAAAVLSIGAVLAVAGVVRLAIVHRQRRVEKRVAWRPGAGLQVRW